MGTPHDNGASWRRLLHFKTGSKGLPPGIAGLINPAPRPVTKSIPRSADFQVCCVAGFQACRPRPFLWPAGSEAGDTAGSETCATTLSLAVTRHKSSRFGYCPRAAFLRGYGH